MKLIAQGALTVGLLFLSTPSFAQSDQGCDSSGTQPQGCTEGVPAPLIAAGIPSAVVLVGGIAAARRARRRRNRGE